MGLDMYLTKRVYVGNEYREPKKRVKVVVPKERAKEIGKIDNKKVSEIVLRVGYWRKANAIHQWFVDNVQDGEDDCGDHYVDREKLEKLLSTCQVVLRESKLVKGKVSNGQTYNKETGQWEDILIEGKKIADTKVAEDLLPTQSGFFFGGTDYDEYYLKDVKDTIKILEDILKEEDHGDIYYHASW